MQDLESLLHLGANLWLLYRISDILISIVSLNKLIIKYLCIRFAISSAIWPSSGPDTTYFEASAFSQFRL